VVLSGRSSSWYRQTHVPSRWSRAQRHGEDYTHITQTEDACMSGSDWIKRISYICDGRLTILIASWVASRVTLMQLGPRAKTHQTPRSGRKRWQMSGTPAVRSSGRVSATAIVNIHGCYAAGSILWLVWCKVQLYFPVNALFTRVWLKPSSDVDSQIREFRQDSVKSNASRGLPMPPNTNDGAYAHRRIAITSSASAVPESRVSRNPSSSGDQSSVINPRTPCPTCPT
jgi:hypothetical protein